MKEIGAKEERGERNTVTPTSDVKFSKTEKIIKKMEEDGEIETKNHQEKEKSASFGLVGVLVDLARLEGHEAVHHHVRWRNRRRPRSKPQSQ